MKPKHLIYHLFLDNTNYGAIRNDQLRNVNKQVNSLKEKGQIVFWEKTELSGMGLFYRVYVGKYNKWDDAAAFRDKLKKQSRNLGVECFYWIRTLTYTKAFMSLQLYKF